MRASFVLTVAFSVAAVATAAPIRPPRVPDDPPLAGQTLAVGLSAEGVLFVRGRNPMKKAEDVKAFLAAQIARIKKVAETNKEEFAPALTVSTDSDTRFQPVLEFLDLAKQAGFRDVRLKR